jgi:PAS domain S-box-containing protein
MKNNGRKRSKNRDAAPGRLPAATRPALFHYSSNVEAMQRVLKRKTAARHQEIDFSKIVEQSLSAHFVVQKNAIVYCNSAFELLSGYSRQDLYSMKTAIIPALFSQGSKGLFDQLMRLCLEGGQIAYHPEICLMRKSGVCGWIEMTISPVEFMGQSAVHCSCIDRSERKRQKDASLDLGEDMTERRRIELAMRENQEKFAQMVEYTNDGISLVDEEGSVIAWNNGLESISGLKREEVLGKLHWDVVYSVTCGEQRSHQTYERIKLFHEDLLTTGLLKGPSIKVHRLQRPDGTRKIVQLHLFVITTSRGHRTGVIVKDITELEALKEEFYHSEARYRSLAEAIPDILFVIARDMKILYVNGNAARFLSKPDVEVTGKKLRSLLPPNTVVSLESALARVFKEGSVAMQEYRVFDQWFETRLTPVVDGSGIVNAVLWILQDITRRKNAEQEVRETKDRAEADTHRLQKKHERERAIGVFDKARLFAITGNDSERLKKYLDLTLFTGISMVDNIEKSLRENDPGKVALLANGIRETALQLGATRVAETCTAVMIAARENRIEACRQIGPKLRREGESLFNALRAIII